MVLGKVIGSVVSTIKQTCYENKKLLLIQPIGPDEEPQPGSHVAVDLVGAGKGDIVLLASEGRAAQELCKFKDRMPLRSIVVGIVDQIEDSKN